MYTVSFRSGGPDGGFCPHLPSKPLDLIQRLGNKIHSIYTHALPSHFLETFRRVKRERERERERERNRLSEGQTQLHQRQQNQQHTMTERNGRRR
ncbi:hypothetical protein RHMOL_Rhmol03G0146200 [Rhododendron molle]|uniref:Uncharacterized protein n=1 Tax=Rhododendron molle TaxID=49168 RepID=A0ACC0PFW6_RHOML|nr:hypothetical protein RHMOL_Rhmol03G0146200 [Rhododendron molle]